MLSGLKRFSKRYSGPTVLAKHATSNDPFGPSPQDLHELAAVSRKPKLVSEIEQVLESRLRSSSKNWRQKSKALTVAHYLLLHGSDLFVDWLRTHIALVEPLTNFTYSDSKNVDQGKPVREKATAIVALATDKDLLATEREQYLRTRQEVRTSIGRGTQSRHTLDLVRGDDFYREEDSDDDLFTPVRTRHSLSLGLKSIAEETLFQK